MILQRPLDSEVDDLQPLIRNSVVLLAERILLDYDSLFKPGTFHPRFQVRLPRWENAHSYKPSRNTRVDSATKAQSIITSWQLQVPVPITAASLPSPEPSTLSSRAQPSVDPSPPTKRRRLTSPSQASGDPSTTRSTSTSSTRPLHITSSLPVIEEPAPVIPDAANDDNRSIPIPGITLAYSELIQMEVTQLSGGWSDLALVTQGTHCLFEIKLLSALTTTAFEAFLRTLRRAPVDMSATGFEPNQPLNRSNLAVHFTWGPDPQAADGGLSETMQKVLGQVFQQLILNRCPRLILSNWDVYVLVWLGADGRVHISRAFSRARDHNRRLRPNMDESPLELLVALQVLVVRLMQAADADTAAEKAECLQAVDPIWQYDGEDWFHNDNARANSVSQPVVGPNRSGGNGGGGSRGRRGSRP
ncbi:uncharacterized protein EHS24_001580 [Apiotrichum porosum]|uniref:Uncharacterized protein n=1 Tax=Apiotrichum porosum TaxID=105984 RepID=A0A427XL13_9TREE|nr:uncharacterized protein EHS24_001580 [Apiotrichum porosum]RSH79528.1 hypothetical protein EHS24_001580 [Apiotrichum porosum]